jgi:SprA-related family
LLPRINILYNIFMELSGISDSSISRSKYQPAEQTAQQPSQAREPAGQSPAINRSPKTDNNTENKDSITDRVTLSGKSQEDPQVRAVAEKMKAIEEKVKAHEAAHKAAGGNLAGPASFSYTQGPDGRSYITGGEVQINISPGKTPEETISRMQQVIRAALAPADPSGQDRAVAAQAASQIAQAQQQKMQEEDPLASQDSDAPVQQTDKGRPDKAPQETGQNSDTTTEQRNSESDTDLRGVANQALNAYASQAPQNQAQNRFSTSRQTVQSISSFA